MLRAEAATSDASRPKTELIVVHTAQCAICSCLFCEAWRPRSLMRYFFFLNFQVTFSEIDPLFSWLGRTGLMPVWFWLYSFDCVSPTTAWVWHTCHDRIFIKITSTDPSVLKLNILLGLFVRLFYPQQHSGTFRNFWTQSYIFFWSGVLSLDCLFVCSFVRLIDWLIDWLMLWLIVRCFDWLIDWFCRYNNFIFDSHVVLTLTVRYIAKWHLKSSHPHKRMEPKPRSLSRSHGASGGLEGAKGSSVRSDSRGHLARSSGTTSSASTNVTFVVNGTHFIVNREAVMQYPETMLGKMISSSPTMDIIKQTDRGEFVINSDFSADLFRVALVCPWHQSFPPFPAKKWKNSKILSFILWKKIQIDISRQLPIKFTILFCRPFIDPIPFHAVLKCKKKSLAIRVLRLRDMIISRRKE